MRLVSLRVDGLRNLAPTSLTTDARFVVIAGDNAQGKTNLLEAAWVLAALRPLRGTRWRDVVAWGGTTAVVGGTLASDGDRRSLRVEIGPGQRDLRLDDHPERDVTAWFDAIRAIAFTPSDAAILTDAPVFRRRWIDRAAFTARPVHLARVQSVRRVLAQKAAVLRSDRPDSALLDVLDDQLARAGAALVQARVDTLRELAPHVRSLHGGIAGGHGQLGLRYRTEAQGDDTAARHAALASRLAASRREEVARRRCLVGPQRDDVRIAIDDRSARLYGSRGQVRSVVLALKLAELVAARARGDRPLFLLDDLSSELDRARTGRLVEALIDLDTQVWVTTTDPDHLGALPAGEACTLRVRDGVVEAAEGGGASAGPAPTGAISTG